MDARDTALVIEGGGLRGAYIAPVIARLIEEDVQFGWVGGVSAGASHTINMLSRDAGRAEASFTTLAAHREFGGWGSFLRGRGYFNGEFIYERSHESALPLDEQAFYENPAEMHIETVRSDTAETIAFNRADVTETTKLMKMVRASSTLPGFMRPLVRDGVRYFDGALGYSGGLLIDAARRAGYDKICVIATRPREYAKSPVKHPQLVRRVLRREPAIAQAVIDRPARYNQSKRQVLDLEEKGIAQVFFPESMPITSGEKKLARLQAAYRQGRAQFEREWPQWREFLGG